MKMIYEKETKKSFEETIDSIKEELKKRNFGVLWELNMKDKLGEHGLDLNGKAVILEVCNPQKAQTVLNKHISVGYFLPCKIALFERDGKTTIGTMLPSELMNQMPGVDLANVAEEVEQILKDAVDAAV